MDDCPTPEEIQKRIFTPEHKKRLTPPDTGAVEVTPGKLHLLGGPDPALAQKVYNDGKSSRPPDS